MSLLHEARAARTWRRAPDTPEFVSVPVEARDALVELADAAQLVAERPFAKDALADFHAALERLR